MASDVVIPEVGELGMDVTFVRWLKAPGDSVAVGDPLFEVDTDKSTMVVEAYAAGTLADISVTEGDVVAPRQVVGRVLAPGERSEPPQRSGPALDPGAITPPSPPPGRSAGAVESSSAAPAASPVEPATVGTETVGRERQGASPRARRVARELGVDTDSIEGTGPDGIVTEADVVAAATRARRETHGQAGGGASGASNGGTHMRRIEVVSTRPVQAMDVTDRITSLTWPDGYLLLSVPHTTAALILGENDPEMLEDYEKVAAGLPAPFEPFKHHRNDNPNASAHVISSFAGTQLLLPVAEGRLVLGTWQRIIFIELDGPKTRQILAGSIPGQPLEG